MKEHKYKKYIDDIAKNFVLQDNSNPSVFKDGKIIDVENLSDDTKEMLNEVNNLLTESNAAFEKLEIIMTEAALQDFTNDKRSHVNYILDQKKRDKRGFESSAYSFISVDGEKNNITVSVPCVQQYETFDYEEFNEVDEPSEEPEDEEDISIFMHRYKMLMKLKDK